MSQLTPPTNLNQFYDPTTKTIQLTQPHDLALDFTNFPDLETLIIDGSDNLEKIDIRTNHQLQVLVCRNTYLDAIDLSHNLALKELTLHSNRLASLDLSHNELLTHLNCEANFIHQLDLSHNPKLIEAIVCGNDLTSLDLTSLNQLDVLD